MTVRTIRQYTVDAFAEHLFQGNPAAVCLLDAPLPEPLMQAVASENNLSDTAFVLPCADSFELRWFTPAAEINLCGHATLASAFVVANLIEGSAQPIRFHTKSGVLTVHQQDGRFVMEFPSYTLAPVPVSKAIERALGCKPKEVWMGRDLLCILDNEDSVRRASPDIQAVAALDGLLLHITAPGRDYDCVSRSFIPKMGATEDPVCGSGHCHIFPYWSAQLGKTRLTGYQASARGGVLYGEVTAQQTVLSGQAVLFAQSEIYVPV